MITAVYGGSFNTPHAGHISVAKRVRKELHPDRLLIMPDYEAPHKEMAGNTPSPEQRLELCRLAFGDIPGVEISDLEILRGGKSYTVDTLTELRRMYPEDSFILVIGSDMLMSFETVWYRFEDILNMSTLAVCSRNGTDIAGLEEHAKWLMENYGGSIKILRNHKSVVQSSSDIRKALAEGLKPANLPESVRDYIERNGLYKK